MKYLIVGLGNPGAEYELTRHNIGFLVLDQLLDVFKAPDWLPGRHVLHSSFKHKGQSITCIKPTTYMNLSGKAVNFWLKELKITPQELLVITDDISLDFGKLRMRKKGSAGGHNGLQNIEDLIGTQEYPRLRFGIGQNYPKGRQADYVLSSFTQEEFKLVPEKIDKAVKATTTFVLEGTDKAMSLFNG